jgi:hypothetical protein
MVGRTGNQVSADLPGDCPMKPLASGLGSHANGDPTARLDDPSARVLRRVRADLEPQSSSDGKRIDWGFIDLELLQEATHKLVEQLGK